MEAEPFRHGPYSASINQRIASDGISSEGMLSDEQAVGCEAVNAHVSTPIPQTLWHYTTYAAFEAIIESKRIWATDYRFLNDRQEFRHSKDLAIELLAAEPEFIGLQFPAREYLAKGVETVLNKGMLREDAVRIMVASFSEHGDQLSQWRGYAANSSGVSIGLDLRARRPPVGTGTMVVFAPCVYRDESKRALLKAVFAHYLQRLQRWWDSVMDEAWKRQLSEIALEQVRGGAIVENRARELEEVLRVAFAELQFDLMRIAPLLKHESFSEENEWRLVLPSETIKMPTRNPIQFRPIRDGLVPYIAHPLLEPNQEGPVHCNDLILGPGSHPYAGVGVNMLFQKHLITTRARPSKVPYRPS